METDIYYYHSDHLGSSSWITSTNGSAIQYMQYHPFGETNIDQRTGDWNARYTFSGKEKDEETGYHYFGARYYDSGLGIWLSVDPMAGKYPSTSPYAYCRNNPIMLVDPNGMSDSPYYDSEGNFLGVDENGFSGEIFITTASAFKAHSKNGIANSKELQGCGDTKSIKASRVDELSMQTQSKIYTHVLNQMSDIDISNLYNNEVSINTRRIIGGERLPGYNNPDDYDRFGFGISENGSFKVTSFERRHKLDLNTVEAIQSYLGIHEYYGHGIMDYSGGKKLGGTHWKAYDAQLNHSTFHKLPTYLQKNVIDAKKYHMNIENPQLYKQIYK